MRAQIQVCSNGQLVLKAERSGDIKRFSLGDWVEVSPAPPESDDDSPAAAETPAKPKKTKKAE